MKAIATQGLVAKNLNPYMGVQLDRILEFDTAGGKRRFRVFVYQAYSTYGCIGPEFNGIAIADDDKRQIICDEIAKQGTGYFGASQAQVDEFERICGLQWDAFRDYVNVQPRLRMRLEDKPRKPISVKVPPMADAQYMTAKEKAGVLRAWVRFVKGGFRQEDFTKALYLHLSLHASFIAHFDRGGFYGTYFANPDDTLRFLAQFDRSKQCVSVEYGSSHWLNAADYADLNNAMVDSIVNDLPGIRAGLARRAVEQAKAGVASAQAKLSAAEREVA